MTPTTEDGRVVLRSWAIRANDFQEPPVSCSHTSGGLLHSPLPVCYGSDVSATHTPQTPAREVKFTPGPWNAVKTKRGWFVSPSSDMFVLADCPVSEADAHLIAAAPELFEALEAVAADEDAHGPIILSPTLAKVLAALAKARGDE